MIFTSVDVEALRYLRAKGESENDFERFLLENMSYGYQRELTYRHPDGWFNAHVCDSATGSLWLTSYCLSVFSQAREVVTIDDDVLSAAAIWIMGHQQPDGGWQPVGWVNNSDLYGGLSGNFALTAFVTIALATYGGADANALARARTWLEDHLAEADSASSLAVGAYALAVLKSPVAEQALDRLQTLGKDGGEGMLYWEPVPVETTAYAVLAFYEAGRILPASAGAAWIAGQKNGQGGFGNTQDTVMALRALVRDALAAIESTDISAEIRRGGAILESVRVDAGNIDIVQTFTFALGDPITLETSGKGQLSVQLAKLYNVPTDYLRSRGGLELGVRFAGTRVAVGDTVSAQALVSYSGLRGQTNMAIAEIGIPTGLRPDRALLQELVGTKAIQRIDVQRRTITVYIDKLLSGETLSIPISFTAAYAAQAAPAPSKAYDYYDPAIEAIDGGVPIVIGETGREVAFLRGDANSDGAMDVADAVRTLEYLFLGFGPVFCLDALDINDSGDVDIVDPICLLLYLFVGGRPPASPYPAIGEDPTEDLLRCFIR